MNIYMNKNLVLLREEDLTLHVKAVLRSYIGKATANALRKKQKKNYLSHPHTRQV